MLKFECYHCDALFKIKSLNTDSTLQDYIVMFCPYCGGDIEEEEEDTLEDDE